jgi:hypothetical protein
VLFVAARRAPRRRLDRLQRMARELGDLLRRSG